MEDGLKTWLDAEIKSARGPVKTKWFGFIQPKTTTSGTLKHTCLFPLSSKSQSTVFRTWSRNSGAAGCQVLQFWRPELLLTDKSSPVEASRPPASSNPSPLIKQASALADFLSLNPTSPVITLCCIYLANLTAGPPPRWSRLLANSVCGTKCSSTNVDQNIFKFVWLSLTDTSHWVAEVDV